MTKLTMLIPLFIALCFSSNAKSNTCDISGVWAHSAKPAKLFIDLIKGEISVYSHETNPESIGLTVLKNLNFRAAMSTGHAKMYNAAEDSFIDVQITAKNCHQLNINFKGEEVLKLVR